MGSTTTPGAVDVRRQRGRFGPAKAEPARRIQPSRVPWTVWTSVAATTAVVVGSLWDISWHISIGRDTFWTPPHLLIQLCAAIGGLTAIYLIVRTTFGAGETARAESVRVFGLRAPLGAFICGWGALAMLTSAPFDNWWHEAYGLDVTVVSPPHMILALGAFGVIYGGFVLTMAQRNRSPAALSDRIETIFMVIVGVLMVGSQAELIEYSDKAFMHSSIFYRAFVFAFPTQLMVVRRISVAAVGLYHDRRRLHGAVDAAGVDPAAVSGGAEARTGVPARGLHGADRLPGADRRARLRARRAVAQAAAVECVGRGRAGRPGLPRGAGRGAVAVCRVPDVALVAQLGVRHALSDVHGGSSDRRSPGVSSSPTSRRARASGRAWRSPPSPR